MHRHFLRFPLLFPLLMVLPVFAQNPSVTEVQNNYSFTNPNSTNFGIAQGSLFLISGTNLVDTSNLSEAFPLQQNLNGVSVAVNVNGVTTNPYLYYVYAAGSQSYIAAVLPSATPVGTGTITVTNNGKVSNAARILVVQTAVGLDTLYGAGVGPAVAQDASGGLITTTNAANPNQIIVLWGTGVGPDTANANEGVLPQQQDNLTNLPLEVDIGGIPATILYRGRSQYPGVDQINVMIPASVPAGCFVSLVAWTGAYTSNFATLPIAASGSTCSDAVSGYAVMSYQATNGAVVEPVAVNYAEAAQAESAPGPFNVGDLVLEQDNSPSGQSLFGIPFPSLQVFTTGTVRRYTAAQLNASLNPYLVSVGSCVVVPAPSNPAAMDLDAGGEIDIAAPDGSQGNPMYGPAPYRRQQLTDFPKAGTFTFTGGGGADVGGFTAGTPFVSPNFVWNEMNVSGVSRSSPLTVTWSGGAPGSLVAISGFAGAGSDQGGSKYFFCLAPVSAQRFTVPSTVLMSLPYTASLSGITSPAFLAVSDSTPPQPFTAQGLDFGSASSIVFDNTGTIGGFFQWF